MPNRSGNTKRKKRNQRKQELQTALVPETNTLVSTSELEEKEKASDQAELSELPVTNVDNWNAAETSKMEEQSLPMTEKKKKKKKNKKKKENNNDTNNNLENPSESVSGCSDDIMQDTDKKTKYKEEKRYGSEGDISSEDEKLDTSEEKKRNASEDERPNASEDERPNASEDGRLDASEDEKRNASEDEKRNASEDEKRNASEDEKRNASEDEKRNASEDEKRNASEDEKLDASEEEKRDASEDEKLDASEEEKRNASEDEKLDASEDERLNASEDEKRNASEEEKRDASEDEKLDASEEEKRNASEDEKLDASEDEIFEDLSLNYITSASAEPQEVTNERHFDCITRLLIGVGANFLRQYFCSIHPTWNNQPTDASALKKGVLKLQGHEKQKFCSGNIYDWDVSLLIRVLRFSDVSSTQLMLHPDKDNALCKIQDIRNKVVGHAKNKEINEIDFNLYWKELKVNLMIIGASEKEIDCTLTDYTDLSAKQYRQLFMEEIYLRKFSEQVSEKSDDKTNQDNELNPCDESGASPWDAWLKFRNRVNSFKSSQMHYILVADSLVPTDLQNHKVLSVVPWEMVLDFNPSSEDDGLYKAFNSQSTLQRILSPWTPAEIKKTGFSSLPKQIDPKRTQWLFVNGRKEDTDDSKPKSFPDWEQQSVKHISTFLSCCSQGEKFDNQKSITCLLLPISKSSAAFVEVTLKRFAENFSEFDLNFVCIDNSYKEVSGLKDLQEFPLSSQQLKDGVECLFNVAGSSIKYKMPSFHGGVFVSFSTRQYVYMSEKLELLYAGCENEAINLEDQENDREKDKEEHRRSFLSGHLISFVSLFFNHDAKRKIEQDIEIHIQRLLNQNLKHSVIVRIVHPPGTGGSTIATRVLWNLHDSFPCAIVKLPRQSEFDEDVNFISDLCDRISDFDDKCGIPAVILLHGHRHSRIQGLSSRIVRTLNSRGKMAVILECQHGSKPANVQHDQASANIHRVFYVDARLEDCAPDLEEFKLKYCSASGSSACRVFHFPMLSMMEEFRDKLEGIVSQTLDDLNDVEKDIAAFVAFLQLYAGQSTPALLLYEAFKSRLEISGGGRQITYDSIKTCFSEILLNLMVYKSKRMREGECCDEYTLQHRAVARLVFDKYLKDTKQSLYKFVTGFLRYGVVCVEKFQRLYCDIFVFNNKDTNGNRKHSFSLLIETLNNFNQKEAADIFCGAAKQITDPRVYGHAARFHAKMNPPKFKKAKDLIKDGVILSDSKGKKRSIQDSKGIILSIELKHNIQMDKVTCIEQLQDLAKKAISAFKLARDSPPTFCMPLLGEVEVWLSCIEWFVKYFRGIEEAIKFITTQAPAFFRPCIENSFNLLDIVDDIVLSSTFLSDPDESRDNAQRVRRDLVRAIKPKPSYTKNPLCEVNDVVTRLLSNKNLPTTSVKEVMRFKARSWLSLFRREPKHFTPSDLEHLINLLERMVLIEKEYSFAHHFLRLCSQIGNYSLEQVWTVCCEWMKASDCYDPMRYYYSMVIAFMQILNGCGPSGFFEEYKGLIKKLRDASRGNCRRNLSLHYLGKNGDGMSRLVGYSSLISGETAYRADDSKVVQSFWTVETRRKLQECTGRLRVKVQGNREVTTIELLQGDIELYVGKSADIGKPGKDFDKDAKVYFVVSFNLTGPIANGITFHPIVEVTTDT